MNYEELFKLKAVETFYLKAEDYFIPTSLESILQDVNNMCKNANDDWLPKSGIKKLLKLAEKYNFICENPTALTSEDQLAISEMRNFLKQNRGHTFGYFKYRKQFYEEEVGRYYEMSLINKMNILANKDIIFKEIENKIIFLNNCLVNDALVKKHVVTERHKKQKDEWAKKRALCVCGREYRQGDKQAHFKTKVHQRFIADNTKIDFIVGENIKMRITEL
jgi:hypothetical protein